MSLSTIKWTGIIPQIRLHGYAIVSDPMTGSIYFITPVEGSYPTSEEVVLQLLPILFDCNIVIYTEQNPLGSPVFMQHQMFSPTIGIPGEGLGGAPNHFVPIRFEE